MRVKIISCWNPYDWYNDKIGEVVEVNVGKKRHYTCPSDCYQIDGDSFAHIKIIDCKETNSPEFEVQLHQFEKMLKDFNLGKISKEEFKSLIISKFIN
jgi:hypothetical protein